METKFMRRTLFLWLAILAFCSTTASANTEYYRHIIFDNSLTPDAYFYSAANANGASLLSNQTRTFRSKLRLFITPPNALRLQ
jgi:exo beta-1,2-glucooligosaccharide sophorohydrolase (non-reducing end)